METRADSQILCFKAQPVPRRCVPLVSFLVRWPSSTWDSRMNMWTVWELKRALLVQCWGNRHELELFPANWGVG